MKTSDAGSTLVEVLVAVIILALAGTALITGTYLSQVVSNKSAAKSNTLTFLDDIAQQISAMPFNDCLEGDPYPTPTARDNSSDLDPNSLTINVQVFNPDAATDSAAQVWLSCPKTAQVNPPSYLSSGVQRIVIQAVPYGETDQTPMEKVLVKVRG